MTAFDVAILVLVALLAWGGFASGFVSEAIRLAGSVAAIVAVRMFEPQLTPIATRWTSNESGGYALAIALLFFGTVLLARILAGAVGGATRASFIGPVDRVLGLGLGLAKGLIAASLLFLLAEFGTDMLYGTTQRPAWLRDARSTPLLEVTSRAITDWVKQRQRTTP